MRENEGALFARLREPVHVQLRPVGTRAYLSQERAVVGVPEDGLEHLLFESVELEHFELRSVRVPVDDLLVGSVLLERNKRWLTWSMPKSLRRKSGTR